MTKRAERRQTDRCPGVLRPWVADDGALVRLRLVGGEMTPQMLTDLMKIAATWADGTLLLTKRANVQLRGIDHRALSDGTACVPVDFVDAIAAAGLLPAPTHELVRNIMVSPLSGRLGGRADLFPVARQLDALLCADPAFAGLSARFLFVLDDGRGDLVDRYLDLGAMAVDADSAQVRVGSYHWGPVVPLADLPETLLSLARRFLDLRSPGDEAEWHVDELAGGGAALMNLNHARDLRTQVTSLRTPLGSLTQDDGRTADHVGVPDGVLTHDLSSTILATARRSVIVTPWRSVLLPDLGDWAP